MKWVYSFVMLIVMLLWACVCLWVTWEAVQNPTSIGVIEASGTGVLLGALISWNANVNNYWFRKKLPDQTNADPDQPKTLGGKP